MDSAQTVIVEEDAAAVGTVSKSPALLKHRTTMRHNDRPVGNSVLHRPLLIKNPLPFFFRNFDQVLPTTAGTVVAAPVLNRW
jgi:hypothetical protein